MDETFYVTVIDPDNRKRVGFLLGPYDHPDQAEAQISRARELAERVTLWSHFYEFGVTKVTSNGPPKAKFGW